MYAAFLHVHLSHHSHLDVQCMSRYAIYFAVSVD